MPVTQIHEKLGSFEIKLRGNIPREVLDGIQYFGHVAVIPGRVDARTYGDGILDSARYVGVVRKKKVPNDEQTDLEQDRLDVSGVGMNFWLGDDDDKGRIIETEIEFINSNFTAAITGLMPPSVTVGNIGGVSGTYSGFHQWQTPRKAIQYVCDTMSQTPTAPNLLSESNSSFETAVSGWSGSNCNLAVTGAYSYLGTKSMAVTATASGNLTITTANATVAPDLTTGSTYNVSYWILPTASGRLARVGVNYKNSGYTLVSSESAAEYITLTQNSWNQVSRNITVPTGTGITQADIILDINQAINGDKYYIDNVSVTEVLPATPVSFRVNNDGSLDAGPESNLFVTNPRCVIVRKGSSSGEDLSTRSIPGNLDLTQDLEDFATRVVILGQSDGEQFSVGAADIGTVSPGTNIYKDLFGNALAMTRMVSESNTVDENADPRAHLALRETLNPNRDLLLSTDEYDVYGSFEVGDYVYVYDPDSNLFDTANEIYVRGIRLNPIKLQVTECEWPVTDAYSVAYRDNNGTWYDLTDYVEWDTQLDTKVTIGDFQRLLNSDFQNVESRLGTITAPDSSTPQAPTWVTASFQTVNYLDSQGNAKARQKLVWTVPNNTDLTAVTDGDHYEIQYKLDTASLYSQTWAAVSTLQWNDVSDNVWNQPVEPDDVQWQTVMVPWGETSTIIHDLPVGTGFDSRIRAVDKSNNQGAWSSEATWITSEDNIPPSTPAPPAVASSAIAIQVIHELGLASGGTFNMENDLAYLEVHYSQDNNFTPSANSLAGRLRADRGMIAAQTAAVGTFTIPETSDVWVRVIAVDLGGNKSSPSTPVQASADLIDSSHISELTASKISAGTLSANVVLAAALKTAEEGQRIELNQNGLQAYNADGDLATNLSANPSGSGQYMSFHDSNGNAVATIADNGDMSAANLYADTDLYVDGSSYLETIDALPKGVVAHGWADVRGVNTSTRIGLAEIGFEAVDGRTYKITMDPLMITHDTLDKSVGIVILHSTTDTPLISSPYWGFSAYDNNSVVGQWYSKYWTRTMRCGAGLDIEPGMNKFLITLDCPGGGIATVVNDAKNMLYLTVEDLGLNTLNNVLINDGSNPSGSDASPITYTKTYAMTWSRSYYGDDTIRFSNGKMYHARYDSTFGMQKSLMGFNYTQIQSDLAGASNITASITLKNLHWRYTSGGMASIGTHNYTSAPTTWADANVNQERIYQNWAYGAKATVSLGTAIGSELQSGATKGIALAPVTDYYNDFFYGYFEGSVGGANSPVLTVTYTK